MTTFAVATIGSLVTIAAAILARLALVPGEIRANDRRARDRDQDLETWICDRNIWLRRELSEVKAQLAANGTLESGEYLFRVGLTKEKALHEWRDQEREARRDVAAMYDRENPLHRGWRRLRGHRRHDIAASARSGPVIDAWRAPPASPAMLGRGEAGAFDDPTERTLAGAIEAARKVADYQ